MKANKPKVFIILLNWNGIKDTLACVKSIEKLSYINWEIIVVDNGSKVGEVKTLEKLKSSGKIAALIKNKENAGFAEGNNQGIRKALKKGADACYILNNDTVLEKDSLSRLVEVLYSRDDIGIVGPKIYFADGKKIWFAGAKINYLIGDVKHIGSGKKDKGQFDVLRETDYVTGAALLVKKEVFWKDRAF